MRTTRIFPAAIGLIALAAACSDSTSPAAISDAEIAADVAEASGEAIAANVQYLMGNESFAGLPGASGGFELSTGMPPAVTRTRTCYDASDVAQAQCDSLTTAKVVLHVTIDGSRTGEHFSGSTHRTLDATISGLAGTETSRTHDAVGTSLDSTSFTGDRGTRESVESATDSVKSVVFELPRSTHPWPSSGSIVRRVSGTVTLTGANGTNTRTYNRRVEVVFPADAQGNVTLHVNDKTCNLNLVNRRVTGCN